MTDLIRTHQPLLRLVTQGLLLEANQFPAYWIQLGSANIKPILVHPSEMNFKVPKL